MNISFAITCHNEGNDLERLLLQISKVATEQDEIIVLDDYSTDFETCAILAQWSDRVNIEQHALNDDFAEHKNYLNSLCTKDWILQLDADEFLGSNLEKYVHYLVDHNETDLMWIPRVNKVEGITQQDLINYRWRVDEEGRIMWPDYQGRLYRNKEELQWIGRVHERIEGNQNFTHLPLENDWAIHHYKTIEKQRQQNEFYNELS
ncbi:MAG: glycosyltransferase [Betaproteobacteria bacterium]|jgi:glycosyltransferase involved in cell wall biosynthesis